MNKSLIIGSVLGAVAVTAGATFASNKWLDTSPTVAEVLEAKPIINTTKPPRQECHDEEVTHTRPVKDENRITGTAIGAVLGGVLGNQIGGGSGKKVATVAGAVAGGYAGNQTQENMQQGNTYTTVEQRCETVYDSQDNIVGYDVTYSLNDQVATVQMDRDPGKTIPVKDGQLVLNDSAAAPQ
jgi:uncharacterized protein YcfJ